MPDGCHSATTARQPPLATGAFGLYTRQSYWNDGPTVESIYVEDSDGNPLSSAAQAETLAALLQTVAADADMAPMEFVVLPLYELPTLPPS